MKLITNLSIYDFLLTQMMICTFLITLSGIIAKIARMIKLTRKTSSAEYRPSFNIGASPFASTDDDVVSQFNFIDLVILRFKNSIFYKRPLFMLLAIFFHLLVILLPFTIQAHAILFFQKFKIRTIHISDTYSIILALVVLVLVLLILTRRLLTSSIRMITGWNEIFLLTAASLPFVTGLLCYYQFGNYEIMMIVHIISAQILVILLGWSKMGHAIMFFFSRIYIRNSLSASSGIRWWGKDNHG